MKTDIKKIERTSYGIGVFKIWGLQKKTCFNIDHNPMCWLETTYFLFNIIPVFKIINS